MVNGTKPTHISILDDEPDEEADTLKLPIGFGQSLLDDDIDIDFEELDLTMEEIDMAILEEERKDRTKKKECECGAHKTPNKNCHADWCPLYRKG